MRTVILVILAFAILMLIFIIQADIAHVPSVDELKAWIDWFGAAGPVAYIAFYAFAPALLIPGFPITMAAGLMFGSGWGIVYASIGSTLGASLPFLIARYLARPYIERSLSDRFRRIDQNLADHGWMYLAITRLIPLFPFEVINYGFGLTKLRFVTYIVVSWISMLPGTIAYVLFGSSIVDILGGTIPVNLLIAVGIVVLLSLLPLIYRRSRYAKAQQAPDGTAQPR